MTALELFATWQQAVLKKEKGLISVFFLVVFSILIKISKKHTLRGHKDAQKDSGELLWLRR